MDREWPLNPNDFSAYYTFAPAALAIRECIRLAAVRKLDLAEPLLDVGCGDGLFAKLAYPKKQAWGIDINPSEVQRAQRTASYMTLICGNITGVHLPEGFFGSAIANCSLEHVSDIQGALRNIRGALKPNGQLVLIVPTPNWTHHLAVAEALEAVGLVAVARAYGDALDRVFAHVHLYDTEGWRAQLGQAGFTTEEVQPIVSRATSWAFDLMLYPSLIGYLMRRLTGRWIAAPSLRPFTVNFARALVNAIGRAAPTGDASNAAEYMILARKQRDIAKPSS